MSSKKIKTDGFELAFEEILKKYQSLLTSTTEEGLDDAAEVFIQNARIMSPKRTGNYSQSWAIYPKKYHLKRYVGNTKTVKGTKGSNIPLINILEYSTKHGNKHVQKIFNASIEGMIDAVSKKIKEK